MRRSVTSFITGTAVAAALLSTVDVGMRAAAAAAPAAPVVHDEFDAAKLLERITPTLVTIKFTLKFEAGGGEQGRETEITGVMIEPDGLVLCSNLKLGGRSAMMGGGSVNATDVKILIGEDTEGLPATILAKDLDLDLAWVRIDDPKGKSFPHLDLKNAATPKVGEHILTVQRLGKFFDKTVVLSGDMIGGITSKPRQLLLPASAPRGVIGVFGMPVLTQAGQLVGIYVTQFPEAEDMEGGDPMAFEGAGSPMILPAAEVAAATERSKSLPPPEKKADGDAPAATPDASTPVTEPPAP